MKRLEGSVGSIWTSTWTTLGETSNQSRSLRILDPEIQQESPDFVSTNHLPSMKANWNNSNLSNRFIWFKFSVTGITALEVHLPLWKWKNKISLWSRPD